MEGGRCLVVDGCKLGEVSTMSFQKFPSFSPPPPLSLSFNRQGDSFQILLHLAWERVCAYFYIQPSLRFIQSFTISLKESKEAKPKKEERELRWGLPHGFIRDRREKQCLSGCMPSEVFRFGYWWCPLKLPLSFDLSRNHPRVLSNIGRTSTSGSLDEKQCNTFVH